MNRREFLKIAGLSGISFSLSPSRFSFAQDTTRPPLFLSVHAGGGWDPTSLCDPKGRVDENAQDPVNRYFVDQIRTPSASSPIMWAPMGRNEEFFQAHYDKLLVVNGIDAATNNHSTGTRYLNSGQHTEGHPSFAAMLAATYGRQLPLGYITNGGYDITRGIVPRTRLGQLGVISRIAEPDKDGDRSYHPEEVNTLIGEYRAARKQRREETTSLPQHKKALNQFFESRSGQNELKRLKENLPNLDSFATAIGQQAAIALAGYKSELTISANLTVGGFDTHGNHDQRQMVAMDRLTQGLMELWNEVERLGLQDQVVVMVSSDFGRTPRYNEGNGKDHWPVTSALFMGAGISGNRVIGSTDDGVRAKALNPNTFEVDETGERISPARIHATLRAKYQLDNAEITSHFPLEGDAYSNLFG